MQKKHNFPKVPNAVKIGRKNLINRGSCERDSSLLFETEHNDEDFIGQRKFKRSALSTGTEKPRSQSIQPMVSEDSCVYQNSGTSKLGRIKDFLTTNIPSKKSDYTVGVTTSKEEFALVEANSHGAKSLSSFEWPSYA